MPITPVPNGSIGGLKQVQNLNQQLQKPQSADGSGKFGQALQKAAQIAQPQDTQKTPAPGTRQPAQAVSGPAKTNSTLSPLKQFVSMAAQSENGLNSIVQSAMSNQNLSPSQLITLQASMYKLTNQADIVMKSVEITVNSAKTVFQTQV